MAFDVAWTPVFPGGESRSGVGRHRRAPPVDRRPSPSAAVDRTAGLVVVPYLPWVASAAVLNYRFLALG
jgi:hypothetical protein